MQPSSSSALSGRRACSLAAVLFLVLVGGTPARAQDATRIYYLGNSLTDELKYDSFVKLVAARGHKLAWGRQMIPGAPIRWLWEHPNDGFTAPPYGPSSKALKEFAWDVVTLQPFSTFEGELAAAVKFVRLLKEKSPDAQVYVYAQWPGTGKGRDWGKAFAGGQKGGGGKDLAEYAFEAIAKQAAAQGFPGYGSRSLKEQYELVVLGLRQLAPTNKPARLIPVGHVIYLLNQKMAAGQVPGYRSAWELYSDGIHVSNVGSFIVGCTFYATIFGQSPAGLPVVEEYLPRAHPDDHFEISPELAKVIQETVWEVVATHPLTGVSSQDPLRIATPVLAPVVAGEPYDQDLAAAFGKGPYQWTLSRGTLPAGLTLDPSGRIKGTAAAVGEVEVELAAADSAGGKAVRSFKLAVQPDATPKITTQELPALKRGQYLKTTLQATGGNGVLTWAVRGGKLPVGLELGPDGQLAGTPGEEGPFEVTVEVADADAGTPETHRATLKGVVGPAPAEVLLSPRAAKAPTIDGKLDDGEWQFAAKVEKAVAGEAHPNQVDFATAWDESHLYVAVRVRAKAGQAARPRSEATDWVEIYVDGLNNRERTYNFDDRRFVAGPGGQLVRGKSIVGVGYMVRFKGGPIEGGYVIELATTWKNLNQPKGFANLVVGLDVANCAKDAKGGVSQVVWRGTAENASDASRFGTVILGAK